jgi:DNA-binding phage protein
LRCLSCGTPIDPFLADTDEPIFKTYRRVVAELARSIEIKRLPAIGAEPTRETGRGLTIPRPVHVKSIHHIGKKVIADPTDTDEELTAEQLSATDPMVYRDKPVELEALRAQIRAIGVNVVAREAGVSRSRVQAFVNKGATPQSSTLASIKALFECR